MSDQVDIDLNRTIASAVNARIEASVLAALSGDEVLGGYVSAALQQEVKIGDSYPPHKTTFLHSVVMKAVQQAVQAAVAKLIAEEAALIEDVDDVCTEYDDGQHRTGCGCEYYTGADDRAADDYR